MAMKYLPDLTKPELKALHAFMKGKKSITEEEVDDFMRAKHKEDGLFENCIAHISQGNLNIKIPIGWVNENNN